MKKYKHKNGRRVVEVSDLSFLSNRNHPYNWFQRHYHHHRLRIAVKKADLIIAQDEQTAYDVRRYYFIPKERIVIGTVGKRQKSKLFRRIRGLIR